MSARVPGAFAAAFLALGAPGAARVAGADETAPVTHGAVWAPPADFVATMHRECEGRSGDAFGACFVEAMRKAGAPEAAVAFARRTGDQGYLKDFRDAGTVDVACAESPFRANQNAVCFLVNGTPPMLDVDDPKNVSPDALRRNAVYAGLLRADPNLATFPGNRSDDGGIVATERPDGGQTFRVGYVLVDGCHACARVGALALDFDFDGSGRFAETRVASVRAEKR